MSKSIKFQILSLLTAVITVLGVTALLPLAAEDSAPAIEKPAPTVESPAEVADETFEEVVAEITEVTEGITEGVTRDLGQVALIAIDGPIDQLNRDYFRRALADAKEAGVDTIINHIKSPGGQVGAAVEMLRMAADISKDAPKMIAWVDAEAISAAAMIAYGHEEVYMSPTAAIGDIGVIFMDSQTGKIEYAPEKIVTYVRAMLEMTSEVRGWDKALMTKMTDRNQPLYEARFADGRKVFVSGRRAETFLADHPEIDREDKTQWVMRYGEDHLLTLTAGEAHELKMATGVVPDIDALYQQLGVVESDVMDLRPTDTEMLARSLRGFAPLLAALAMILVVLELKTSGVGIFLTLAIIAGVAFFMCQYYLDLATHWEVVLLVLGTGLILSELFFMWSGGIAIFPGMLMVIMALVFSFMPNGLEFDFSNEEYGEALAEGFKSAGLALAVIVIAFFLLIFSLPKLGVIKRMAVQSEIAGTSAGAFEAMAAQEVGKVGEVVGELRPNGTVRLNGSVHTARSKHGSVIATGSLVNIVGSSFGELVVIEHDAEGGNAS